MPDAYEIEVMNTKPCPFCAEEIKVDAVKCRYCGEFLSEDAHHRSTGSVVTIQATSRKWKMMRLMGGLIVVAAAALFGQRRHVEGTILTVLGIAIIFVSLVGAWWTNG